MLILFSCIRFPEERDNEDMYSYNFHQKCRE
jgi:hypothetical protein